MVTSPTSLISRRGEPIIDRASTIPTFVAGP
jgi:hypothetical protein